MCFCQDVLAAFFAGAVEYFVEELLRLVTVSVERYVAVSILEFVGMSVTVSNVDADYDAIFIFWWRTKCFLVKFERSSVYVPLVGIVEAEESLEAGASELEHRFLTIDFHFSGIFECFVEGSSEGLSSGHS